MSSFDDAFAFLTGNEGGYSFNPKDPGGETMFGITARVARANGYTGAMKDLPLSTAKTIAKTEYWNPLHLDEFDPLIALQMLEANYNGGHTVLWAQEASGADADGRMGLNTIAAIKKTDPRRFCFIFLSYRLDYMTEVKTWGTFGRGWAKRIARCLKKAGAK